MKDWKNIWIKRLVRKNQSIMKVIYLDYDIELKFFTYFF